MILNFMEKLLTVLDTQMETPGLYGWFHLLWLAITAAAVVLAWRFGPRASKKQVHNIVLVTAIVVTVLEIYKQINFTFSVEQNGITADYPWYIFPFQFCSTPMYVGLLAGLIRKGKVSDCLCAYLATYAVFAGLVVMLYPGDVFVETIGINIQTMFCHGSMLPIGALLFASGRVRMESKTVLKAVFVFTAAVALACVMNEIAYFTGLLKTDSFNMFYVSPHCDPHLPVYSLVQQKVAFPWSLLIYIAGFSAAAYLMMLIPKLLSWKGRKQTHYDRQSNMRSAVGTH